MTGFLESLFSRCALRCWPSCHLPAGIYDRRRYGHAGQGGEGPAGDAGNHLLHQNHQELSGPVRSRRAAHGHDSASVSDDTEFEDSYIVECACGIQFDDGNLMIECEHCKAWAHTACLQKQMVSLHRYGNRSLLSTLMKEVRSLDTV